MLTVENPPRLRGVQRLLPVLLLLLLAQHFYLLLRLLLLLRQHALLMQPAVDLLIKALNLLLLLLSQLCYRHLDLALLHLMLRVHLRMLSCLLLSWLSRGLEKGLQIDGQA